MKKYIVGFLTGVLFTGIVSTVGAFNVLASNQNYTLEQFNTPIYVEDSQYSTYTTPVLSLNIDGHENIYVPLRDFSKMLDATVSYNRQEDRIDIKKSATPSKAESSSTTPETAPIESTASTSAYISLKNLDRSYDDKYQISTYTYNDTKYVNSDEIEDRYFDNDYKAKNDKYDFDDYSFRSKGTIALEIRNQVVLADIPAISTTDDDEYLIEYDYFVNTIYPIIK